MNGHIQTLVARATTLHRAGRHAEAIDAYRHVLGMQAALPDSWFNLAYLLKARGRFDEALDAYAKALEHGVAHPEEVHLNRAVIFSDHLRRSDDAEAELRTALGIRRDFGPALLNLGNLHEERGRREDALDCYDRILKGTADAEQPGTRHEALARMLHLREPSRSDEPLLLQAATTAFAPGPSDDTSRATLLFALGRTYDTLGLYDQAFEAFVAGNRYAGRAGPPYDRARMSRLVDALIAAFPATAGPGKAEDAGERPAPLFICGMFRSGSTLVEKALSVHPKVVAGGEIDFLLRVAGERLAPFPTSMATRNPARDARLAQEYREHLLRLFPEATAASYITDKRPDNFLLIGLIKRLFPQARIIHTVRNPLDNGLSVFMQHLAPQVAAYSADLGDIGHYYGEYRRLIAHWKVLCGDSLIDFDYDRFVINPETELRELLGFLGLAWEPRCLAFHEMEGTVKTASYWQVRRPLYTDASGRWRHYDAQLAPLRATLLAAGAL